MEHLDTATQAANWFDAFIKHGSVISLLLSLGCGWGLSISASYPIHWYVKDDERATFFARVVCIVGSFAITAGTWPNDFRWSWALFMGVLSPLVGLIALAIIKNRWPTLFALLSMKKSTPESTAAQSIAPPGPDSLTTVKDIP